MRKPRAVSRLIATTVTAASFALALGLSGCQREPDATPEPKPEATKSENPPASVNPPAQGPSAPRRLAQTEGIPESGVELGWGWNTRTGSVVSNRCVEFAPVKATGQRATLSMREVSDKSDVMDSLGVSASVSVSAIFGAKGSAQAEFAKDSKVSSTSTSLLLRATVENGVIFTGPKQDPMKARRAFPAIAENGQPAPPSLDWKKWQEEPPQRAHDEVVLTPWADDLLRKQGVKAFLRHCGDSYVSAIYSGADLLAITTFTATSQTQKENITAALQAEYGVVQASASVKKNKESTLESTNMHVSYMQVGGGSGILPTTRELLVTKLGGLAKEAAQDPKFHSMEVTPYDQLASWPVGSIPPDDPEADDTMSNYYWALTSLNDDIQSILDDFEKFSPLTGLGFAELQALQDEVNKLRADIRLGARFERTGTPEQSFTFRSRRLAVLNAEPRTSFSADWAKRSFLPKLEESVPQRNVNLLRLSLPLPLSAAAGLSEKTAARAVVEFYVGRQSKRICARNPRDSECLSNEQLRKLEGDVRLNYPTPVGARKGVLRLRNIRDGLCLTSPDGKGTSRLITAKCEDSNPSQYFYLARNGQRCSLRLDSGALNANGQADKSLVLTAYSSGVVHAPCNQRTNAQFWTIRNDGQVDVFLADEPSHLRSCLESGGGRQGCAPGAVRADGLFTEMEGRVPVAEAVWAASRFIASSRQSTNCCTQPSRSGQTLRPGSSPCPRSSKLGPATPASRASYSQSANPRNDARRRPTARIAADSPALDRGSRRVETHCCSST
jgi:Ricin-type beta-trefoil lectin domain